MLIRARTVGHSPRGDAPGTDLEIRPDADVAGRPPASVLDLPDRFVRPKSRTVMRTAGSPRARLATSPGRLLSIDVECEQVAEADGTVHSFSAGPFGCSCRLSGLDASLRMAALLTSPARTSPIRSFQFYRSRRYCGSASAARMLPWRWWQPCGRRGPPPTTRAISRRRGTSRSARRRRGVWSYALCLTQSSSFRGGRRRCPPPVSGDHVANISQEIL